MDYREMVAVGAQQVINKGVDYSQIHVARLESGWSLAYRQEPSNFVADQWFPMVGVQQIAGLYPKWAMENAFTNKAGTWRPGTIPPQGELAMDTPGSYVCQRYAFEMTLAQDLPYVADPQYNIEMATTNMVTDVLQLNKELIIANNYFKKGVWGIDIDGANSGETYVPGEVTTGETFRRFNDEDSDPLSLFKDLRLAIKQACGVRPNMAIMGEQLFEALRINSQLISMYRNPQGAESVPVVLEEAHVARALGIDKLIVARAMYNKNKPGDTVDLDWIFGKSLWYGYVDTPGPLKTIAAMNLSFNDPLGGFDTALARVPDLHTHTEYFQGFQCWAPVVMAPKAGAFLYQAIA